MVVEFEFTIWQQRRTGKGTELYCIPRGTLGKCKAVICDLDSELMGLLKQPEAAQGVRNWRQ